MTNSTFSDFDEEFKFLIEEIVKEPDTFTFEEICGENFVRRKTRPNEEVEIHARMFVNISDGRTGTVEIGDFVPPKLEFGPDWKPQRTFHIPTVFGILLGYPVVYLLNEDERTGILEGVDLGIAGCKS